MRDKIELRNLRRETERTKHERKEIGPMEKTKRGNLTEGPILKVLTKLALPIMASAFLMTAYNITDMAFIGMLGSKAVAGVGVGGMFIWLSQGFSNLARMGGQVYVGQCLGQGDREGAKEYALAAIYLCIVLGVIFGSVCFFFADPIVKLFGLTDDLTIFYAKIYLQITCGLIVISYISAILTGLYTAQGDSKTPMIANTAGLIINLVFNPILIFGIGPFPRLEVIGAAVATVSAQFVVTISMILIVIYGKSQHNILKEMKIFRPAKPSCMKNVFCMGLPTALQSMFYCMISMVLTRLISGFGEAAIAVQRVGGQIESISWNVADGFAAAMNAFAAQNFGAGKIERVKKGYNLSAVVIIAWGTFIAIAFCVFPEQISSVFFHEANVIWLFVAYLVIVGLSEPFMCLELMTAGTISGLGNTKLSSKITIVVTALRIPIAFFLSSTSLGLNGIWWALTLTSMAKGIAFYVAFHRESRRLTL